jgi:hypothetical protein
MREKPIGPSQATLSEGLARSQIRQRRTPPGQKQEPHHRPRDMARRAWALQVAGCMRSGSGHCAVIVRPSSGQCPVNVRSSQSQRQPGISTFRRHEPNSERKRQEKRCADNTPILQARASMVASDFSSRGIQILRSVTGGQRRLFRPSDAPKHPDASSQRASFSTSLSSITFTPNSFALSSFVPASAPATT